MINVNNQSNDFKHNNNVTCQQSSKQSVNKHIQLMVRMANIKGHQLCNNIMQIMQKYARKSSNIVNSAHGFQ